jgi:hypothetical protein
MNMGAYVAGDLPLAETSQSFEVYDQCSRVAGAKNWKDGAYFLCINGGCTL